VEISASRASRCLFGMERHDSSWYSRTMMKRHTVSLASLTVRYVAGAPATCASEGTGREVKQGRPGNNVATENKSRIECCNTSTYRDARARTHPPHITRTESQRGAALDQRRAAPPRWAQTVS
jgi:hypothetical protein